MLLLEEGACCGDVLFVESESGPKEEIAERKDITGRGGVAAGAAAAAIAALAATSAVVTAATAASIVSALGCIAG